MGVHAASQDRTNEPLVLLSVVGAVVQQCHLPVGGRQFSPFGSPIGLIHQPRNFLSYEVFLQIGVPMGS